MTEWWSSDLKSGSVLLVAAHGARSSVLAKILREPRSPVAVELDVQPQEIEMFEKLYNVQGHYAHTLSPSNIGSSPSGWVIEGEVHEDYFEWVNEFEATHPVYGRVWGDFETVVYADSEEGFEHFLANHPPDEWDYWDI